MFIYLHAPVMIPSKSFFLIDKRRSKDMHILRLFIFIINFPYRKFVFSAYVSISRVSACPLPETSAIFKFRF